MEKTVFIIGAGASKEVGMPLGDNLKDQICESLKTSLYNSDNSMYEAIFYLAQEEQKKIYLYDVSGYIRRYVLKSDIINSALPWSISIDHYLKSMTNDKEIIALGKLAITHCILTAENKVSHYFKDIGKPKKQESGIMKTWYPKFIQKIILGFNKEEIKDRLKTMSLVIFNYDRCFEHFMHSALMAHFNIGSDEAHELCSLLNIYHPYGVVGFLPWQGEENKIAFGGYPSPKDLISISKKIKTFAEGLSAEHADHLEIKETMSRANKVVFLGFSFFDINMELIKPDSRNSISRVYATACGFSDPDIASIKNKVSSLFFPNSTYTDQKIMINNITCSELFKEYSRSILA